MSVRTRLSNDQYYYLRNILTDYVDSDTGAMRLRSDDLLEQLQIKLNEAFAEIPTAISSSHLRRIVADAGYTLRRNRVCRTSIKDLETQIDKMLIRQDESDRRMDRMAAYIKRRLPGEEND